MRHILIPCLGCVLLLAACGGGGSDVPANQGAADGAQAPQSVPLMIRSGGAVHRFTVEVARTPAQQEQGLMFRKELAEDGGMIFPFDPPKVASFWMKNTVIPLDMLFIRPDGTIAFIAENTVPYALQPVSAGQVVMAVLELRGGRSAELGIKAEDKVEWVR